jgi:hypothetical protein
MTGQSGIAAGELLARVRGELVETAEAIRSHRFLERLRSREVADERLRALAAAQHAIVSSDRRSFAVLAARFPSGLAGEFFLGMAEGEGVALDKLRGLADWLGMTDEELRAHEPHPGAQAYPAFVAWLALNGSRADVALAFLANLAAWGENCGQVAAALAGGLRGGGRRGGVLRLLRRSGRGLRGPRAGGPGRGTRGGRLAGPGSPRDPATAGLRTVLLGRARRRLVSED